MKIKVRANKLENATATHISLVERGANRIPFKIMKQESSQMINLDLSRVFKSDSAPITATILGYVMQKADNTEAVKKALGESGVKLEFAHEFEDGTVIYKQAASVSDDDLKSGTIFKISDNLAVVCKGVSAEEITDGLQASVVVKEMGFLPSLDMATDALMSNIGAAIAEGGDIVTKVEEALGDFNTYVVATIKSVPAQAFVTGMAMKSATVPTGAVRTSQTDEISVGNQDGAAAGKVQNAGVTADSENAVDKERAKQRAELGATYVTGKSDGKKDFEAALKSGYEGANRRKEDKKDANQKRRAMDNDGDDDDQDQAKKDEKKMTNMIATALKAATEPMSHAITALAETMRTVTKSVSEMGAKVETAITTASEARELATKGDKLLRSTLITGNGDDDEEQRREHVAKGDPSLANLDTAFHRTVRKSARTVSSARSHRA